MIDPLERMRMGNPVTNVGMPSIEPLLARLDHEWRQPAAQRPRRPMRRATVIVLVLLAALLAAAVALAASGLLTGEPVKPPAGVTFSPTRGVGVPIARTEKLLDLRVPDPSGGPAWGMRVLSTTRGLGCVQVGRVVDGRLGVLGQDGAFADDGRFHELPPDVLYTSNCTLLDGAGQTYVAVTWSAMPASAMPTACGSAAATSKAPPCPARDRRLLRFGLLGSQAASIAYRDRAGRTVTQRTVGPQGAYLIVLPADPRHPGPGGIGVASSPGSGLTSVRYRDGHVCHIRPPVALGGAKPCPLVGYVAPPHQPVTTAQVAAPVRAHLDRRFHAPANGYRLSVSFTARVAARGGRASYVIWLFPQRSRGCGTYASGNGPDRNVAAGERVHSTIYVSATCPGRLRGRVVFDYQAGASTGPVAVPFGKGEPTVGTFAVTVPRRR
jgi:hypothetical protein